MLQQILNPCNIPWNDTSNLFIGLHGDSPKNKDSVYLHTYIQTHSFDTHSTLKIWIALPWKSETHPTKTDYEGIVFQCRFTQSDDMYIGSYEVEPRAYRFSLIRNSFKCVSFDEVVAASIEATHDQLHTVWGDFVHSMKKYNMIIFVE